VILGLEFPPLSHLVDWPDMFLKGNELFAINKVVLIYFAAILFTVLLFTLGNKGQMVPTGAQNIAESAVGFIEDGIARETIGHDGPKYTPLLTSFFFFILFCNIFEIIPGMQMPATARIAVPMFLALFVWVTFIGIGIVKQGPFTYLKNMVAPPGLPIPLYFLVIPIEFVSVFLVRPFSLMVRLFANLLAGHILLVTFTVLSAGLWTTKWYVVFLPLPVVMVVIFTVFEAGVAFLQAYVFTLLAGVYIGSSLHADH
jgi:F-type H+-transporting ATPase subunit a